MEIGDLIIRLLDVLVWPVVVVVLALIFRPQIAEIILRISKFKYKDFEFEFGKRLREAEQTAQEVQLPQRSALKDVPGLEVLASSTDRLLDLAPSSPRLAIIEAWLEVESAVNKVASELKIQPVGRGSSRAKAVVVKLVHQEKLPSSTIELYDSLRRMRNNAAHVIDFDINTEDAARFVDLAIGLAQKIRMLIS